MTRRHLLLPLALLSLAGCQFSESVGKNPKGSSSSSSGTSGASDASSTSGASSGASTGEASSGGASSGTTSSGSTSGATTSGPTSGSSSSGTSASSTSTSSSSSSSSATSSSSSSSSSASSSSSTSTGSTGSTGTSAGSTGGSSGSSGTVLTDEVVAPDTGGATTPTLLWDASGEVHALYRDATDGHLLHAYRAGGQWLRERAVDAIPGSTLAWQAATFDSAGTLQAVYVASLQTGTYTSTFYTASRPAQGGWSLAPLNAPLANPGMAIYEPDGTLAFLGVNRTGGTSSYSTCDVVALEQLASGWTQATVYTFHTYDSYCSYSDTAPGGVTDMFPFLDGQGRLGAALLGPDNSRRWSMATLNAQGGYDRAATPMGNLIPGQVLIDAQGTFHLFGQSDASGNTRHVYGGGVFWTEEEVTGMSGVAGAMVALPGGGLGFARLYLSSSVQDPNSSAMLNTYTIERCHRTGVNAFATDSSLTYSPGFALYSSDPFTPHLPAFDSAGLPVLVTGRQQYMDGVGLDLTDWPGAGAQRTQPIDWKEAVRGPVDIALDAQGVPSVLLEAGEAYFGQARLVLRKKEASGWTESAPVLPAGYGNGNGQLTGKVRIGSDGLRRVATVGAIGAGSSNVGLVLATEDASGAWSYELVQPLGSQSIRELDLFLDSGDVPHLVWSLETNNWPSYSYDLHYATRASSWADETVGQNVATTYPKARVVVDGSGTPSVGYVSGDGAHLGFARRAGGVWQAADLAYDGNLYGFGLAVDGQGRACVLHVPLDSTNSFYQPTVTCLAGNGFQDDVIGPQEPFNVWDLRTDGQGHLTGLVSSPSGFTSPVTELLHQTASGWSIEPLADNFTDRPAFALAADGTPWFSFLDSTQNRIRARHP